MLSSLEIPNFKGIKSGSISDLAQVNILVGRNNSGKPTILDALLLMRCAFAVTDYLGRDGMEQLLTRKIDRRENKTQQPDYRELSYMLKSQEPISVRGVFTDGSGMTQRWDVEHPQVGLEARDVDGSISKRGEYGVGGGQSVENFLTNDRWEWMAGNAGHDNSVLVALGHLVDTTSIRVPTLEPLWEKLTVGERRDRKLRDIVNHIYKW